MQNCSKAKACGYLKLTMTTAILQKDKKVTWANFADQYAAFMMWQCGHKFFRKKKMLCSLIFTESI